MTEAQFQEAVIQLARYTGWLVAHFRPAQTSRGWRTPVAADGAGFPDLVLVHPQHGVLFRELKGPRGRVAPAQARWIASLKAAGADAEVWTPGDWPRIESTLKGTPL